MENVSFLILAFKYPPLRENQPGQCQNSSNPGHPRERLVQDQDRSHNGDHRGQIDIDAGPDRSQQPDSGIPRDKAECGSTQSEKQKIQQVGPVGKAREIYDGIRQEQHGIMKRSP